MKIRLLFIAILLFTCQNAWSWGFFAHKKINRFAVYLLPAEMFGFYKHHIQYITENAVNPDRRRYAVEGEAPRHFIDIDVYGDSALYKMPRRWKDAVERYTEDTLQAYGIVPWHINIMKYRLEQAMKEKNVRQILLLSADLGHYIADANVPLHTTENYNGQLTGQHGIHGFWESRLPELFIDEYTFFFEEKAKYLNSTQLTAWQAVTNAHLALDSVLKFEKELTLQMGEDKKYSFENRNNLTTKVYSKPFSEAYHKMLNGQVERRMRASIQMVADFWYTAWIDAGQPDLENLKNYNFSQEDLEQIKQDEEELKKNDDKIKSRPHEKETTNIWDLWKQNDHQCCCELRHNTAFVKPKENE